MHAYFFLPPVATDSYSYSYRYWKVCSSVKTKGQVGHGIGSPVFQYTPYV